VTTRFRLNRGGDRQANAALHRIVLTRMSSDQDEADDGERGRRSTCLASSVT